MAKKQGSKAMPASTTAATTEELRAVRLELPLSAHKQFRVEAAKEDTSMASIARQLVEDWLVKRKTGAK